MTVRPDVDAAGVDGYTTGKQSGGHSPASAARGRLHVNVDGVVVGQEAAAHRAHRQVPQIAHQVVVARV